MPSAPLPSNEADRLGNLRYYQILDSAPENEFDSITNYAAEYFGVPIAIISMVDQERQWVKSGFGMPIREVPRGSSFCAYTILSNNSLVIPDTTKDARSLDNQMVTNAPHVRFYAGHPLTTSQDYNIGTLCLMDNHPRELDERQVSRLSELARSVTRLMELRLSSLHLRQLNSHYREEDKTS